MALLSRPIGTLPMLEATNRQTPTGGVVNPIIRFNTAMTGYSLVEKTRDTLMELIKADDRILKDPEPFVALSELGDSSVNFVVRVWVEAGDYWGVYFDMNENVYNKFNEVGLNIPFPQMDIHVQNTLGGNGSALKSNQSPKSAPGSMSV